MTPKGPIIALVDDDKIFQLTASKTIKATGLSDRILQFENGEEALHYLKQHTSNIQEIPDVIFLDINMPFVDGWMFLEEYAEIKGDLASLPKIYMVSSSIDPRDINRAKNDPSVSDYVVKPVSVDTFRSLIG